jgi:hypothetical protein
VRKRLWNHCNDFAVLARDVNCHPPGNQRADASPCSALNNVSDATIIDAHEDISRRYRVRSDDGSGARRGRRNGQSAAGRAETHVAAAKAAAGAEFAGVFDRICAEAVPPATPRPPAAPRPPGPPPRESWHAEPARSSTTSISSARPSTRCGGDDVGPA